MSVAEPVIADGSAQHSTVAAPDQVLLNQYWADRNPLAKLSVVVPFMNFDVVPLAQRLVLLAARLGETVSLVFVDDGSPDPAYWRQLWALLSDVQQPCQLAVLRQNVGRAKVRNYLCQLSTTPYLLYLDADMWPDHEDFLQRYLAWITECPSDVIYGGRSADKVVLTGPDHELHRQMTVQREALPASVRRESPVYHFYSCNFLVRRDILASVPLEEKFTGWGWEDIEWAARVAEHHQIRHEDNPASHLGLLTAAQILKKYDESVGNFQLILSRRPDIVMPTSLFRAARVIGRLGMDKAVAWLARRMAVAPALPISLRMHGLMLYKAALYARLASNTRP